MQSLRRYFATGLLVLVPLGITLWVLKHSGVLDGYQPVAAPRGAIQSQFPFNVPWLGGVVLTLLVVLTVGVLTANFIGARLLAWWEALLRRIPVVNSIYSSVKQVSDTLFSRRPGRRFVKPCWCSSRARGPGRLALWSVPLAKPSRASSAASRKLSMCQPHPTRLPAISSCSHPLKWWSSISPLKRR